MCYDNIDILAAIYLNTSEWKIETSQLVAIGIFLWKSSYTHDSPYSVRTYHPFQLPNSFEFL